jgi:hypothetical protein
MTHEQQLSDNNFMYNNDTTNSGVGMATIWPDDQQKQQQKIQDNNNSSNKPTHPEWGVMKEQDFHPLTLKHQIDLENSHQSGNLISDFYFWQANLGGYCMADMVQSKLNLLYTYFSSCLLNISFIRCCCFI